ncbi:hypothetical protein AGMMS49928_00070 [Spirochaetia bacterium]|nr:hypothetical protein AGMMS49928_00070 [Spirochaetia bacterium]
MTRKFARIFSALGFIAAAIIIVILYYYGGDFFQVRKEGEWRQPRIITARPLPAPGEDPSAASERLAREDRLNARVALDEGEILITALNGNFDGDPQEEQIIAYRKLLPGAGRGEISDAEDPINITYIDYDEEAGGFRRIWNGSAAVTRPLTLSLYTQDLVGDRGVCVLVTGMNGAGEHIMAIFRKNAAGADPVVDPVFEKIAEITIDGSISIKETERSGAYQMGQARGASFPIVAYGRDHNSKNILDQLEITYVFNEERNLYEQRQIRAVPGAELEQRRVRELLSGNRGAFESFITGLWYYVSPQGTLDSRQYIYFDPEARELIFYGDETQQVFTWQNSSITRYGLYISSQNISVTTLRRFLDIELESLESIRVKVFEDVRLKIGVNAPWDGSYRRASPTENSSGDKGSAIVSYQDAAYEGAIGRLRFSRDGSFEMNAAGSSQKGSYAFFVLGKNEVLELRSPDAAGRDIFLVERSKNAEGEEKLSLKRIRIGAQGISELPEPALSFTAVPW